jgi:hypothetical protein
MPTNEHLFPTARLRQGHRSLAADRTLVQVEWAEGAERFDLRSAAFVATAVADVDVPANACPMAVGQVWEIEAGGASGPATFQALTVRLTAIRPGTAASRRWYTWQFLIVRKPVRDPYALFPRLAPSAVEELPETEANILGDLKALLASDIADAAVARFNAEGGFCLPTA